MIRAIALALSLSPAPAAGLQEGTDADAMRRQQLEQVNALGREISARIRSALEGGNLLAEVEALRALEEEYQSKGPMAQQVLALHLMERTVVLGNYGEALRWADLSQGPGGGLRWRTMSWTDSSRKTPSTRWSRSPGTSRPC